MGNSISHYFVNYIKREKGSYLIPELTINLWRS